MGHEGKHKREKWEDVPATHSDSPSMGAKIWQEIRETHYVAAACMCIPSKNMPSSSGKSGIETVVANNGIWCEPFTQ
jgi:hypothetical protein